MIHYMHLDSSAGFIYRKSCIIIPTNIGYNILVLLAFVINKVLFYFIMNKK